jgi:hypothetical protein
MAKSSAGGGINSKQVRQVGQRLGSTATGFTPGGVAQFGQAVGDHTTEGKTTNYKGDPLHTKSPPAGGARALGNTKTMSYGAKGQGRTVMSTGTQQVHGPINPGERKPITGPDPTAAWWPSNNAARRSPVKR